MTQWALMELRRAPFEHMLLAAALCSLTVLLGLSLLLPLGTERALRDEILASHAGSLAILTRGEARGELTARLSQRGTLGVIAVLPAILATLLLMIQGARRSRGIMVGLCRVFGWSLADLLLGVVELGAILLVPLTAGIVWGSLRASIENPLDSPSWRTSRCPWFPGPQASTGTGQRRSVRSSGSRRPSIGGSRSSRAGSASAWRSIGALGLGGTGRRAGRGAREASLVQARSHAHTASPGASMGGREPSGEGGACRRFSGARDESELDSLPSWQVQ